MKRYPSEATLFYVLENHSIEEIVSLCRKYPFLAIEFYRHYYNRTGKTLSEINGVSNVPIDF